MQKKGMISAPGRICLFGEHQDYLGLPVIPMSINKRLRLHYQLKKGSTQVELYSNQLKYSEKVLFTQPPTLNSSPYNYQKAIIRYFWKDLKLFLPSKLEIDSKIPIRSGLSSSAALLTATVFLFSNIILNQNLDLRKIAEIAYHCEHDILGISCGRMDQ
jgi:galactokinase